MLRDLRQPNAFGLGEGFVEPGLLQLVCQRLWDEANNNQGIMDNALYEKLGGANSIIRDFVWRHLENDAPSKGAFKTDQRVLWAELTQHLSVARGVKSAVTAESLARKLRIADLGIAGRAVAAGRGLSVRNYLSLAVERRGNIPEQLLDWISETLDLGHSVGFLKRQEGFKTDNPRARLFELSHDGLDDVFRTFSLEFEKWVTKRIVTFWAAVFIVLFILPFVVLYAIENGIIAALLFVVAMTVGFAIYAGLIWLMLKLFDFLAILIYYPIVRRLTRGPVKFRAVIRKSAPVNTGQSSPTVHRSQQ